MVAVYLRRELQRDRALWEKSAYVALWVANSAMGRKRPLQFKDVMPKFQGDYKPVDVEQRRREAMETFRLHKSKFWTVLGGSSLDDIEILGLEIEGNSKLNGDN